TSIMTLQHEGKEFEFAFPDGGNVRHVLSQIFTGAEYPIAKLGGYRPSLLIDIGANVGAAAIFFASVYPQCQIRCYEPSPTSFEYLQKNIAGREQIVAYNVGLWNRDWQTRLYTGRRHLSTSSIVPGLETSGEFEMVELRRASTELDARGYGSPSIL